ncbi:hypothetical protein FRC04_001830 [Tulasnella sp. 424]|nr:hypothetical protein FRC04_001830 [Tulasnella sp. 424]KAG8977613.1 hypothetical protein FRC05_000869 [Tulasnella sp. 425]
MSSTGMDDLIASFSSTAHISQEAVDLAALQAQLSSSLMMGGSSRAARPCPTTPTMGTMDLAQLPPSATPSPQTNVHHSFGQSMSQATSDDWTEDMMDEEMIEQSLLGLDAQPHHHHQPQQLHHHHHQSSLGLQNHYPHMNQTPTQYYATGAEDNSFSSYAAVDPFFAAQLQAAQLQQQQQQQQASYFGGFAPARGFGARQSSTSTGAFGSRF